MTLTHDKEEILPFIYLETLRPLACHGVPASREGILFPQRRPVTVA